jgi:hypothetical protein
MSEKLDGEKSQQCNANTNTDSINFTNSTSRNIEFTNNTTNTDSTNLTSSTPRNIESTHTTTNTDFELPTSTLSLKHVQFANAATDTTDIIITSETSVIDDDNSDSKSYSSVNSQLEEEFYDPIQNGIEVESPSNNGYNSVQDCANTKNLINDSKKKSKTIEESKPVVSRGKRSRAPFPPKKVIKKGSNNRMGALNKKNGKDGDKCGGSPPKKVVNAIPPKKIVNATLPKNVVIGISTKLGKEDSHCKSHQISEKEFWKLSSQMKATGSLNFQSNKTKGSPNFQTNKLDEHCKSHAFTKVPEVSNTRKVGPGPPNFQSKLSDEHCKSHRLESPKSKDEPMQHLFLRLKNPRLTKESLTKEKNHNLVKNQKAYNLLHQHHLELQDLLNLLNF